MSDSDTGGRPRWTRGPEPKGTGAVELGALTGSSSNRPEQEQAASSPSDAATFRGSDPVQAEPVSTPPTPVVVPPEPDAVASGEGGQENPPPSLSPTTSPLLEGAPWPREPAASGAKATIVLSGSAGARPESSAEPSTAASGVPLAKAQPTAAEAVPNSAPSPAPAYPAFPPAERIDPVVEPVQTPRPSLAKPTPPRTEPAGLAPVAPPRPAPPPSYAEPEPAEDLRRPYLAGVDPRVVPREGRKRGPLLIGVAALAVLGTVAAAAFWPRDEGGREAPAASAASQEETGSVSEAGLYLPPDREAVRDAYAEVGRIYRVAGAPGLADAARRCFADLAARPTYRGLDYCSAVDAFGAALAPEDDWFGGAEPRFLQTAEVVMGPERDALARLVELRRLAVEVARESGPAVAAGARAQAGPPPPSSVQVETVEPSAPPPGQAAQSRPVRDPPPQPGPEATRRAQAAPRPTPAPPRTEAPQAPDAGRRPRREVDAEAYAAARRPEAGPTAAQVAAARPRAGDGPSFNCRIARSASERLVCADPDLARLDRRLNAAYEDAIAAGADRRALRREQDQWLAVRERAAPDPDAVADTYRRRIEELDDIP